MQKENIFINCGAVGADTEWCKFAKLHGHKQIDITPNDGDLRVYYKRTNQIAKILKRTFPTKNSYVNNLLLRNIKASNVVSQIYAVGKFDLYGNIVGGIAWTCCELIDRNHASIVYFFDQTKKNWYLYNHNIARFMSCNIPPRPTGTWLGIGSRDLSIDGRNAIVSVWCKPE